MSGTPTAVLEDDRYREHRPDDWHPEHPDRLNAVGAAIAERRESLALRTPREAEPDEILRVHGPEHLSRIEQAARSAPLRLDPDTYVSPASFEVARLAAGGAVDLALAVARGEARTGLAALRPPGHHAEADRAMGFCLFNNVAIAARALQRDAGLDRILILDWDVHHGNGTQKSFEDDPSVLYLSTHQFPYYPGTGDAGEAGAGRGLGATVNVPMPAGCGDTEYVGALRRVLVPVAESFRPQLVLVSCGFDAHHHDPLAGMELSRAGYREMTRIVRALAESLCGGRVVFLLEGGYSPVGLYEGTAAVLDVLLEPETPELEAPPEAPPGSLLRQILEGVIRVHGGRHPGLGAA